MDINNANGVLLALVHPLQTGFEIRRKSVRGDFVNLGRRYDLDCLVWIKDRMAKENGFVTWENWKKILREMKKATGKEGDVL